MDMASEYEKAVERAEANGLITLEKSESLGCFDCGYTDIMAYAIGPCPECGSPRASQVKTEGS